jgi:hypothetical protein
METRTRIGVAPLLFTAPHTIYLHRDAEADHKPEDLTGFLCETFAESTGGSALTWSRDISSISARTAQPQAGLRDPNYLRIDELPSNPWNEALRNALQRWPPWACLHCDLHGRRDHHPGINDDSVDASDCDCGLAAMRARAPPLLVRTIERALLQQLGRALSSTEFVLNLRPRLSGGWTNGRCTLSQQAVEFRYAAVQLELSLRLRRALHADDRLRDRVAAALAAVARIVYAAAASGGCSLAAVGDPLPCMQVHTRAPSEEDVVMPDAEGAAALPYAAPAAEAVMPVRATGTSVVSVSDADMDAGGASADADADADADALAASPRLVVSTPRALTALFVFAHPLELLELENVRGGVRAVLPDHTRAFAACPFSCSWGGGLCVPRPKPGARLYGAVYWLTFEQLASADRRAGEGERGGTRRVRVRVRIGSGGAADRLWATATGGGGGTGNSSGASSGADGSSGGGGGSDGNGINVGGSSGGYWVEALTYLPREASMREDAAAEHPSTAYLCLIRRAMEQSADPHAAEPLCIRSASTGRVLSTWTHPAGRHATLAPSCAVLDEGEELSHGEEASEAARERSSRSSGGGGGVVAGFAALPLLALLTEVGMRVDPPWTIFDAVAKVHAKLVSCGVDSTAKLIDALSSDTLNSLIKEGGRETTLPQGPRKPNKTLRSRSLAVMRELLLEEV